MSTNSGLLLSVVGMCHLSEKHWTRIVLLKDTTKKPRLSKTTLWHVWCLPKTTWMFHSSSGKIFCGQMRQTLTFLVEMHNTVLRFIRFSSCFAILELGCLVVMKGTMSSKQYQDLFQKNVKVVVHNLKLNRECVMHQIRQWLKTHTGIT